MSRRAITAFGLGCFALFASLAYAQQLRTDLVDKEIVWSRVRNGPETNPERKTRLEELFLENGCKDEHLTNQVVKGSKLPNVICTLPGTSDLVIIVGAHFDNEGTGAGLVDNWSGASLLPTLYHNVSQEQRKHMNVDNVGSTDSESFRARNIPSMTVHSLTQRTFGILHSYQDQYTAIRIEDYFQTYRILALYLVYLDNQLP